MEFAHEIIVVVEGAASVYTNVEVGEAGTVEALFNVAIGFVEVEGEAAMSMVEGAVLVGGIGKNESRGESSESKGRAETTGEGGHGVRTDWEWETRGCWIRWRDICEGGGEVKGKNVVDVLGREGGLFGTRTPRPSPGSGGRLQQPHSPGPGTGLRPIQPGVLAKINISGTVLSPTLHQRDRASDPVSLAPYVTHHN